MSAAFETKSPSELNAALSEEVLEYLQDRREAPAEEIITAVRSGHPFMSSAPIVTAIWSLASESKVEVRGDWTVALRRRESAERHATG